MLSGRVHRIQSELHQGAVQVGEDRGDLVWTAVPGLQTPVVGLRDRSRRNVNSLVRHTPQLRQP